MKKAGIHIRLLGLSVLMITMTTLALGYIGVSVINHFVADRFHDRMDFFAKHIAVNAEFGILINNSVLLERLAGSMAREKDISRVAILDNQGNILAEADNDLQGPFKTIDKQVFLKKMENGIGQLSTRSSRDVLGSVQVSYSTRGIKEIGNIVATRFAALTIGLAGIACLILYWLSRSIVSPLARLVNTARKVSRGRYDLRVDGGVLPETRELALAFNEMLDSIEWHSKKRKEAYKRMSKNKALAEVGRFSMTVAHELKNPLGIIKSSFDLLKKDNRPQDKERIFSYIEEEIQRVNRLVEDFLLFARPAKPRLQPVLLNNILNYIEDGFRVQYSSLDLVIDWRNRTLDDLYIDADTDLLIRAINNILRNAVEASPPQGRIQITSFLENDCWILEIRDQGEGIPDNQAKKIFEPFYTTKSKGSGLGLAFTEQVIKAHDGRLTVENGRDEGAVFRVEVDLRGEG